MKEPAKIKLSETPSCKDVRKIPLPPLYKAQWDIDPHMDDIYIPNQNKNKLIGYDDENNSQNDSESIQQLESL